VGTFKFQIITDLSVSVESYSRIRSVYAKLNNMFFKYEDEVVEH